MANKNFIIIIILFSLAGLIGWSQYFKDYQQQDTVEIHSFPMQIGEWTAEELPITDREYAILETRNAFTRKYTRPDGQTVFLFIVYSQTNPKAAHPPEICYSGGGISILSNEHAVVYQDPALTIRANKLKMEQQNYLQYIYYWFKAGKTFSPNYVKAQAIIAFNKLLNKRTGNALIRISVGIDPENPQAAEPAAIEFTRLILPHLQTHLP